MLKLLFFPLKTGETVDPESYAEAWKVTGDTENCDEAISPAPRTCTNEVCQNGFFLNNSYITFRYNLNTLYKFDPQKDLCKSILSGPAFLSCQNLVDTNVFIEACVQDMCHNNCSSTSCLCSTISEFSHQCAHAGGTPQAWKTAQLCGKISDQSIYMFRASMFPLYLYQNRCF